VDHAMSSSVPPEPPLADVAERQQLPGARAGRDPSRAIKRGPSRLPPEVVAATQRDRLLDGLVQTVAEKGYVNARVGDICLAAGVTRPAFYALFEGKEDAFIAAYQYGAKVLYSLMKQAHTTVLDWPAAVRCGLRTLLDTLAAVPSFARVALVEIDAVGPAAREERDRLLRECDRFYVKAPPPPLGVSLLDRQALMTAVTGGCYAMIRGHVAAGDFAGLPGLLPTLTYHVLVPFIGPEEAALAAEESDDEAFVAACLPPVEPLENVDSVAVARAPMALFRTGT
jgi:AcrR family transcriptional regulator